MDIIDCINCSFFKYIVCSGNDEVIEAIACHVIIDGHEGCRVAFLPIFCLNQRERYINKFAQVVELFVDSESSHKRGRGHRYKGMASCMLLDDIPVME
jgi:hypothetical protein